MGLRELVGNLREESKTIKMDLFPFYLTAKVSNNRHWGERRKRGWGLSPVLGSLTASHGRFPICLSEQPALSVSARRTLGCEKKRQEEPEEGSQLRHIHLVNRCVCGSGGGGPR